MCSSVMAVIMRTCEVDGCEEKVWMRGREAALSAFRLGAAGPAHNWKSQFCGLRNIELRRRQIQYHTSRQLHLN
jgi:hypothetical protein